MSDCDLPGMWTTSDFEGGDPDERSYAERATPQPAEEVSEMGEGMSDPKCPHLKVVHWRQNQFHGWRCEWCHAAFAPVHATEHVENYLDTQGGCA